MSTSTEERYSRATRTSHLEVKPHEEAPGDADTIIAAGMVEPLGVLLARLRSEWDTISKTELKQAADSLTARVLVLMQLRSLKPAAQAMLNFSLCHAEAKGVESDAKALGSLVQQVMDIWLDRLCHHCDGRGFSGGFAGPKIMCTKCGGSGSRRQGKLGANISEHAFGLWLLNTMDNKCAASMGQLRRKMRRA
jgi:hypothetical protein